MPCCCVGGALAPPGGELLEPMRAKELPTAEAMAQVQVRSNTVDEHHPRLPTLEEVQIRPSKVDEHYPRHATLEEAAPDPPGPTTLGANERVVDSGKAYEVLLDRSEGGHLGLGLDLSFTSVLQVLDVATPSLVSRHNSCAPEEFRIQPLDFITAVNGLVGIRDMLRAIKEEQLLRFRLHRSLEYVVKLEPRGRPLGVNLVYTQGHSMCLEVKAFANGVFTAYNMTAPPELQVRTHDFVLAVNGITGKGDRMVQEMRSAPTLEFRLLRGPG